MESRYRPSESLINLQLVEQIDSGKKQDIKLYRITDFGKDMLQTFKK